MERKVRCKQDLYWDHGPLMFKKDSIHELTEETDQYILINRSHEMTKGKDGWAHYFEEITKEKLYHHII